MSERNVKLLIQSILDAIEIIHQYTETLTVEEFQKDRKTRDAVLMQLLVLGESASRVPESFRDILPDVEWGRIIRSRHIIAHEYHGIDYEVIWRMIKIYLPALKIILSKKLENF
jgi:uncharacterized protein with HEPN domain